MIVDFRTNPDTARFYDILDAETGENLNHLRIVHADDRRGIVTRWQCDESGQYLLDEHGCLIAYETEREIKIEVKAEFRCGLVIPKPYGKTAHTRVRKYR